MRNWTGATAMALVALALSGCGERISRFAGMPEVAVGAEQSWPRLVDTPSPPRDRLQRETGVAVLAALSEDGNAASERRATPVPPSRADELGNRAATLDERRLLPAAEVDEAALRARGAALAERRLDAAPPLDSLALRSRAAALAARTPGAFGSVDETDLAARAARLAALRTSAHAPGIDEASLSARAARLAAFDAAEPGPRVDSAALVERAARMRARATRLESVAPPQPAPRRALPAAPARVTQTPHRAASPSPPERTLSEDFASRARRAIENRARADE